MITTLNTSINIVILGFYTAFYCSTIIDYSGGLLLNEKLSYGL